MENKIANNIDEIIKKIAEIKDLLIKKESKVFDKVELNEYDKIILSNLESRISILEEENEKYNR